MKRDNIIELFSYTNIPTPNLSQIWTQKCKMTQNKQNIFSEDDTTGHMHPNTRHSRDRNTSPNPWINSADHSPKNSTSLYTPNVWRPIQVANLGGELQDYFTAKCLAPTSPLTVANNEKQSLNLPRATGALEICEKSSLKKSVRRRPQWLDMQSKTSRIFNEKISSS